MKRKREMALLAFATVAFVAALLGLGPIIHYILGEHHVPQIACTNLAR